MRRYLAMCAVNWQRVNNNGAPSGDYFGFPNRGKLGAMQSFRGVGLSSSMS
jgi:hypothetical protein